MIKYIIHKADSSKFESFSMVKTHHLYPKTNFKISLSKMKNFFITNACKTQQEAFKC